MTSVGFGLKPINSVTVAGAFIADRMVLVNLIQLLPVEVLSA